MSKAKHTPGPWFVFVGGRVVEVQDVSGKPVAHWAGFDSCNRPLSEQKANARLMASAPVLLALLDRAVSMMTVVLDTSLDPGGAVMLDSFIDEARVAIAAAKRVR